MLSFTAGSRLLCRSGLNLCVSWRSEVLGSVSLGSASYPLSASLESLAGSSSLSGVREAEEKEREREKRSFVQTKREKQSFVETLILKSAYDKLDPRTSEANVEVVTNNLKLLYEEYKTKPWTSSTITIAPSPLELLTESPLEDDMDSDLFELERSVQLGSDKTKTSLDLYLDEPRLEMRSFTDIEVLNYWKTNGHRHGDLASLACDLLSIPITTVASESAFSVGGRVLNLYRNRLLPKNVQALICTRNWLRGFAEFEGDIEDNFDDEDEDLTKIASNSA